MQVSKKSQLSGGNSKGGVAPLMVGHNFRVSYKIGSGAFGEVRLGK